MKITDKNRDFSQPIIWNGDLNDDCTAKWSGLMLRAEWMDEDYWWWCVYDLLDNKNQIDSSNDYNERFIGGKDTRNKAEEVARNYLKDELISEQKKSTDKPDIGKIISDLKIIGISPMYTILALVKDFGYEHKNAKNRVFDSSAWKGLKEHSEILTQTFLDVAAQDADEVEIIDGRVASVTIDLTRGSTIHENQKPSFWNKLKSKFK